MSVERIKFEGASEGAAKGEREQSSILFPYLDLDAAVEVAKAIYSRAGLGSCSFDELAAEMMQTLSGAFRLKTGTARIFELTERDGKSGVSLTDLGRQIVQPESERAARAEAFMRVPLYAAIYEKYKGHLLPPMKALEREMQALGVSSKQKDKARQAFERSARQAGYFESGDDRLVRPRLDTGTRRVEEPSSPAQTEGAGNLGFGGIGFGGAGGGSGGGLHPFIRGLLETLPAPGSAWDEQGRADWLQTAASMFKLIYTSNSTGNVTVSITTTHKQTAADK
jgi:hypothetical protein